MTHAEKHLSMLGFRARDQVTGMEGVITGINFDLYGCIQATLHPGMDKEGKLREPLWFDISRLMLLSSTPVMAQPDFISGRIAEGLKGHGEKPASFKS
jgi:hypothetical protein